MSSGPSYVCFDYTWQDTIVHPTPTGPPLIYFDVHLYCKELHMEEYRETINLVRVYNGKVF